jgi:hypothetical protein
MVRFIVSLFLLLTLSSCQDEVEIKQLKIEVYLDHPLDEGPLDDDIWKLLKPFINDDCPAFGYETKLYVNRLDTEIEAEPIKIEDLRSKMGFRQPFAQKIKVYSASQKPNTPKSLIKKSTSNSINYDSLDFDFILLPDWKDYQASANGLYFDEIDSLISALQAKVCGQKKEMSFRILVNPTFPLQNNLSPNAADNTTLSASINLINNKEKKNALPQIKVTPTPPKSLDVKLSDNFISWNKVGYTNSITLKISREGDGGHVYEKLLADTFAFYNTLPLQEHVKYRFEIYNDRNTLYVKKVLSFVDNGKKINPTCK